MFRLPLGRLALSFALFGFFAACDQVIDPLDRTPPKPPTTSRASLTLPPELPKVDSIRVQVVRADSPSAPPLLATTVASLDDLVLDSLPAGQELAFSVEGLAKQLDGSLATWWTATSTTTLAGSDSVRALALVPKLGDIAPPRAVLRTDPAPAVPDSLYHLAWTLTESDTVEVWIDGVLVGKAIGSFSWSALWPTDARKVVIALFRDKAGNVSTDTVPVARPGKVSAPSFFVPGKPTEVDRSTLPYVEHYVDVTPLVLQTSTPGATLEYSLDTCRTWQTYSDTLKLAHSIRAFARATRNGLLPSDTVSSTYQVYLGGTAIYTDPGKTPPFNNSIKLVMATSTPGATIRCSLDSGKTWIAYADSLVLARSVKLLARSTKQGMADGKITEVDYTIETATPFFPYPDSISGDAIPVAIECITKNASVLYSLDSGKTWHAYTEELAIAQDVELWTKATRDGTTPSGIAKKTYQVDILKPWIRVAAADGSSLGGNTTGSFDRYLVAHIGTELFNASLRYTLDGSDPTASSPLYGDSLLIDTSCTLKARAFRDGAAIGPIASATYVLEKNAAITLNTPDGGIHWWTTKAKLASDDSDLVLHCTTDGSDASRASPVCDDSIDLTEGVTIKVAGVWARWPRIPVETAEFKVSTTANWRKDIAYGSITDDRDGKRYRTVVIGRQRWMAENLAYAGANDTLGECPDWIASNCGLYGRFYDWYDAMGVKKASDTTSEPRKGICPTGWHIPSKTEWEELLAYAGSSSAEKLKATASWDIVYNGTLGRNGTDALGFRLLASGVNFTRDARTVGTFTVLWTSTHVGVDNGWSARFDHDADEGVLSESPDLYHLPVRCVEN